MNRDLIQIRQGLAQARAALDLLDKMLTEYEARSVNILPREDVRFYSATDDQVICGSGLGQLQSQNEALHEAAEKLADIPVAVESPVI